MVKIIPVVFFALPLAAARAGGDQPPAPERRTMSAVRCREPPHLDGLLDDPCWPAEAQGEFVESYPNTGAPANPDTRVRAAYDGEALFFAVECLDPEPEKIVARVTRRDRNVESDALAVVIDSRRDGRNAQFFVVNAACVQKDGTIFDENQESLEWDGVWDAACRIGATGWTVEMRIPLKLLRFRPGKRVSFGINFRRWASRQKRQSEWQFMDPASGRMVSLFGVLEDLELPEQPLQLEFAPFVAARPHLPADASHSASRPFDLGLDGRLGLGGNFNLTFAMNPDFGQVEADQIVLNLSTYETFYPEKRPFFLEDMGLFQTPALGGWSSAQQFYTRRIGRAPREPKLTDDEELLGNARVPRIYGALKLTGETSGRLQVGLLEAVTSREEATVLGPGYVERRLAEPLGSFSLLRLRQGFLKHSAGGLLLGAYATPDQGASFSAGGDLSWELFDGDWTLGALGFATYLSEARYGWQDEFVRAALERDGPLGYGGRLRLEKTGGQYLVGSLDLTYYSPNLALNDTGYLERADRLTISGSISHRRTEPLGPLARYWLTLGGWVDRSCSWLNLGDGLQMQAELQFKNGWGGGSWLFTGFPLCDDRETRSEGRVAFCYQRHRWKGGAWIWSDSSLWLHGWLDVSFATTERGWSFRGMVDMVAELSSRWQLDLAPGYYRSLGSLRWIDTYQDQGGERFFFAEQHVEYWDLTLRSTLAVLTTLSLQLYAQLFLAAVDHGAKFAGPWPSPASFSVSDLLPAPEISDDYDYTSASLNLSAVVRWEYLPGSVIFLVYSASLADDISLPEFRPGGMMDLLPDAPAQHMLMLKISYLWN